MATFSVVCMAKEEDVILQRFLAYYLRLGVDEVTLFIDHAEAEGPVSLDPFDEGERKRIRLTYCDDDYWKRLGQPRPNVLVDRQCAAFTDYFKHCAQDWLLACDIDEYFVSPERLSDVLDRVPDDVASVTFFTIEAVWAPQEDIDQPFGSTWFRIPFPTPKAWQRDKGKIYGPVRYLMSSRGLVAHHLGKSMTRPGSAADEIKSHWANANGECISVPSRRLGEPFTSVRLAHFDAINFNRWRKKFLRRGGKKGAGRGSRRRVWQRRIANFANRLGSSTGRYVFRRLYCLTDRQMEALEKRGQVCQLRIFDVPHDTAS